MKRSIGELGLYRSLPAPVVLLLGLLTQLGDVWFLGVLLVGLFWRFADRRPEIAGLGGIFLAGIGLNNALKHLFAFPRPEITALALEGAHPVVAALFELTTTASGYGFPSGHAFNATLVYVGLAGILSVGTRSRRYGVATGLVALISLTRVGLGVHFVVDVVTGAALGLCVLLAVRWAGELTDDPTTLSFALAIPAAGAYVLASGGIPRSVLLLGTTTAFLVAWHLAVRSGHVRPDAESMS